MIDNDFAVRLVERYGSPLYAYDLDTIATRARELLAVIPESARLLFSLKANPLPEIGAALKSHCSAEVSSPGELGAAIDAGFDRKRILYTGPGKTVEALHYALRMGVMYFSCESWTDAERLARVARLFGDRPRVLLRVNPSLAPRGQMSMSRGAGQFGIAEEKIDEAPELFDAIADAAEILGVHVYLGTQLHDLAALETAFRAAVDTAVRVARRLSVELRIVDVGGGFPWPYANVGGEIELAGLRQPLAEICLPSANSTRTEFWFESGRYLCASAGTLLARVVDDKIGSGGRRYVVLDAGINVLGGMAGLGRVLAPAVSVIPIGSHRDEAWTRADVVGPLCTPLDLLARDVQLPPLESDSLVAVPNVGAYGLTASLVAFLSHPAPVEVVYRCGNVIAARRLVLTRECVE